MNHDVDRHALGHGYLASVAGVVQSVGQVIQRRGEVWGDWRRIARGSGPRCRWWNGSALVRSPAWLARALIRSRSSEMCALSAPAALTTSSWYGPREEKAGSLSARATRVMSRSVRRFVPSWVPPRRPCGPQWPACQATGRFSDEQACDQPSWGVRVVPERTLEVATGRVVTPL